MDIISIYALTASGVFVTLFLISFLPYLYHLAQIIELYISCYLIFPFFLRHHRFAGPWTRAAVLVHLLYTTFNLFCLCFRVSSSADFAGRAGNLAVVNMVALFMAGNPSAYSDIFSSSRPLLSEDDQEFQHQTFQRQRQCQISQTRLFIIHGFIFALYTVIIFGYQDFFGGQDCHKALVYSPARESIKYEKVTFHGDLEQENPYKGPPRPELDAAWHELLQYSNIRVSAETLRRINKTSVKLAGGSDDYFGALNVHHHLHCLKYIRHYMHKDYYNETNELDERNLEEHIDHCLDDIRQALMCHADISIYTYDWIPNYRKPWPIFKLTTSV